MEEESARETYELELRDAKASIDRLQLEHISLEERLLAKSTEVERCDTEVMEIRARLRLAEQTADQDVMNHDDSRLHHTHSEQREKLLGEREQLNKKQDEMRDTIKRLHDRTSSIHSISPTLNDIGHNEEAVDPFSHSRSNSSTNLFALQMSITSKDRQILALESKISKLESRLKRLSEDGHPRIAQFEKQVVDLVEENARLRDDIDGYQTLLQDKTVNGEFSQSQFMQSTSSNSRFQSFRGLPNNLDLASELDNASERGDSEEASHIIEAAERSELELEVLKLQETNKALTLYINTIVTRMLNTEGFEHLLAKDPADMTPIPPQPRAPPELQPAASFLERTKSVLSRRSAMPETTITPIKADVSNQATNSELNRKISNTSSLERRGTPSPHRSVDDSSRRTMSPGKNRSPPTIVKGLRPLASGIAADHISAKEARRLSVKFAPAATPPPLEMKDVKEDEETSSTKNKRSSWMSWLGAKSNREGHDNLLSSHPVPQTSSFEEAQHMTDLKTPLALAHTVTEPQGGLHMDSLEK